MSTLYLNAALQTHPCLMAVFTQSWLSMLYIHTLHKGWRSNSYACILNQAILMRPLNNLHSIHPPSTCWPYLNAWWHLVIQHEHVFTIPDSFVWIAYSRQRQNAWTTVATPPSSAGICSWQKRLLAAHASTYPVLILDMVGNRHCRECSAGVGNACKPNIQQQDNAR